MLKYENSTLKIYIWTFKHYTDIDPTVDFAFPVNKIDCENSDKNSYIEKFEATKCVFRSWNLWKLSKELNMFLLLRTTVLCTVVYHNIMKLSFIASVVAYCNTSFIFRNYRLYGISSVLFVEETRVPRENHQPFASHLGCTYIW